MTVTRPLGSVSIVIWLGTATPGGPWMTMLTPGVGETGTGVIMRPSPPNVIVPP